MGKLKELWNNRTFRAVLIALAALLLLLALWFAFGKTSSEYSPTQTEARLICLLNEIEGVDGAKAVVSEEEGRAVSAVVVFEGKDSILTRSRILDITASLLRIDKKNVQVYPAQA